MLSSGQPSSIFIVCADLSAEAYAWDFVCSLPNKPQKIQAIGGKFLEDRGVDIWKNNSNLSAIGFIQFFIKAPRIISTLIQTIWHIKKHKPSMLVLVDAGVFNMRLIRYTHNLNIPTYYIMPPRMSLQHRPEHSNTTFIYYYDFEKKQLMGLNAHQVKHPKASLIKQQAQREFPIKKLALFPGSRRSELKHHIPILESIRQSMNMDAIYYIQQPHNQKLAQKLGVPKSLIKNTPPQDITADFAICSSGTITLELALRHIPMVCIYKLGKLDYLLIKQCVNVKHIALPNIILDAKRVPELIQHDCNAKKITHHIQSLTKKDIDTQLKDFESIREKLLESPSLQSLLSEE